MLKSKGEELRDDSHKIAGWLFQNYNKLTKDKKAALRPKKKHVEDRNEKLQTAIPMWRSCSMPERNY
jgi:type VI protein secretion system component VasF